MSGYLELGGIVQIEPEDEFGTCDVFLGNKRGHGDGFAILVADVEIVQLVDVRTVIRLCLDIHLPLLTIQGNIVNEQGTHVGLEDTIGFLDVNSLGIAFVHVQFDTDLWNSRHQGRAYAGDFRSLGGLGSEYLGLFIQILDTVTGTVLQNKSHTTGGTYARNSRWGKTIGHALRYLLTECYVEVCRKIFGTLSRSGAFGPGLESDEDESAVGTLHSGDHVETDDAYHCIDAVVVEDDFFHVGNGVARTLHGGGIG